MTRHPAKFTDAILTEASYLMIQRLDLYDRVLDPFAGTGKGVDYLYESGFSPVGVELEPEWASLSPRVLVGNALALPFKCGAFDAIFTSPAYGNRMADHHNARDACKACGGDGLQDGLYPWDAEIPPCSRCRGSGLSRRNTYKAALGRDLTTGSSAVLQWGNAYRAFHWSAWWESLRVLRAGGYFLLNISDHVRRGEIQRVTDWHARTIIDLGTEVVEHVKIETPRNRQGANGALRVAYESLILFRKL